MLRKIDDLRQAGIKVYTDEELSPSDREVLLEEFRTTEVSFFRIQERRDDLRQLYQKRVRAGYYRVRKSEFSTAGDSDIQTYSPPKEYWRRRSARASRK